MSRPLWFVGLVKAAFPSRFLAARATKVPVLGNVLDRWLFGGDELLYLPPDGVLAVNQSIEIPEEVVLPSQVVEHFINQAGTHWIMNSCICRDSNQCAEYPIELGCLFLGEAATEIHPALGRRVTRREALEHAQICREAGLVHLIGRNKLDTIWLGVGPGDRLLTICHCCPCCCLWRTLPHLAPQIGAKVQRMPGVQVRVTDQCAGCGICTEDICFVDAIHLEGTEAMIDPTCRGCGRCVTVCPQGAIELTFKHNRFVEASIARISPLVDVS